MVWKTYLIMHFGTNGKKPTDIAKAIESLGFETTFGSVDFVYKWSNEPTKQQALELGNKIADLLKGSGSVFNLDTNEQA